MIHCMILTSHIQKNLHSSHRQLSSGKIKTLWRELEQTKTIVTKNEVNVDKPFSGSD